MKKILTAVILAGILSGNAFAYYQAEQGRWLNRDPIQEEGGVNLNVFVENKPINKIDHLGLFHTLDDCEDDYDDCKAGCRSMPNCTRREKWARSLCWRGCMAKYSVCIATANETLAVAGVVVVGAVVIYYSGGTVLIFAV